jgi:hypothetical protein
LVCKDVIVGLLDWFNQNQKKLKIFVQHAKDELSGCAEEAQDWDVCGIQVKGFALELRIFRMFESLLL